MSNLDSWIRYADEMGYKASYGKCKADAEAGLIPFPPELDMGEYEKLDPDSKFTKKCNFCGNLFYTEEPKRKYCDSNCKRLANLQRIRDRRAINSAYVMSFDRSGKKNTSYKEYDGSYL